MAVIFPVTGNMVNVFYGYGTANYWRPLNDSFQGLTSRSVETGDCP